MEFDKRKTDFQQADRAFEDLKKRRERGEIGPEEFDAERQRLMVLDGEGRWWAKSGETGAWNYHDGKAWVAGTPPGYEPAAGAAAATSAATTASSAAAPSRPESSGSRAARRWPIAVLGVFVVLLIGGGLFYFLTRPPSETVENPDGGGVEVPDLVGAASLDDAREAAGDDFEVVETGEVESKEPIGSIAEQNRKAGENLEPGSTIEVKISKGVEVLEVIGNERDPAVELLEGRLFDVSTKTASSPDFKKGQVISMTPEGGSFAEVGTPVTLTIGTGEEGASADENKDVPDVIGDSVENAKEELADAGFEYEVETVQSEKAAGTVVSTDPEAGTSVDPSAKKITIKESSGPSDGDGSGGSSGSSGGAAGDQYTPPDTYNPPDSWDDGGCC